MQTRSKVVELDGQKFQICKLQPDAGSFIFMRMLGVSMRTQSARAEAAEPTEAAVPPPEITGDTRIRALSFAVFSGGMNYEDFQFIQRSCLKCVARITNREGVDFPEPIVTDAGEWLPAASDIADDIGLVMKLATEVLVFCFASFFDKSGTPTTA